MPDIYLTWNSDLEANAQGDLRTVDERDKSNQRIVRRLLTNPGDYIWNLNYGGGLALAVGAPVIQAHVEAIVRRQLELEAAVLATPAPSVKVGVIDPAKGAVGIEISYAEKSDGAAKTLTIMQS